jgi:hypothetical protein
MEPHARLARPDLPAPGPPVQPQKRCCPFCGSERLALEGRIPRAGGVTKVEQRCNACEREFFGFIQGSEPLGEQLPPTSPRAE